MIAIRYLMRELVNYFLITSVSLLLIFLSNQSVRYLHGSVLGNLPPGDFSLLMTLQLPYLLSIVLPLSTFLAIIVAYGKLYADNEMTILLIHGFTEKKLLFLTLRFALIISSVAAILALIVNPQIYKHIHDIVSSKTATSSIEFIYPNKFQSFNDGKFVVYANKVSQKKEISEIFLIDTDTPQVVMQKSGKNNVVCTKKKLSHLSHNNKSGMNYVSSAAARNNKKYQCEEPAYTNSTVFFVADSGNKKTIKFSDNIDSDYMILKNGFKYEGSFGEKSMKIMKYDSYGIKIKKSDKSFGTNEDTIPTIDLWKSMKNNLNLEAEFQWRFAAPIMLILLSIIGVRISKISPRKTRYSKILLAATVYIAYAQLLYLSRAWIKSGFIQPFPGSWGIHFLFLLLAIVLFRSKREIRT